MSYSRFPKRTLLLLKGLLRHGEFVSVNILSKRQVCYFSVFNFLCVYLLHPWTCLSIQHLLINQVSKDMVPLCIFKFASFFHLLHRWYIVLRVSSFQLLKVSILNLLSWWVRFTYFPTWTLLSFWYYMFFTQLTQLLLRVLICELLVFNIGIYIFRITIAVFILKSN